MKDSNPAIDDDHGFRDRLQQMLEAQGISQNELARRIGTTSAYISAIMRGRSKPGLEIIQRIGEATGVSIEWLVMGRGTLTGIALDLPWFKSLALRRELVRLARNGNPEANLLLHELEIKAPSAHTESREKLLDQLARTATNATAVAELYASFPPPEDPKDAEKLLKLATTAVAEELASPDQLSVLVG